MSFLPIPKEMLEAVPNFNPMGSMRRLQSVIEMVYLDDDEEDFEVSMDDLANGSVSWSSYNSRIKTEAVELAKTKNPNDSFKVEGDLAAVKLSTFKFADMKVEPSDDENDCTVVFISESKPNTPRITEKPCRPVSKHFVAGAQSHKSHYLKMPMPIDPIRSHTENPDTLILKPLRINTSENRNTSVKQNHNPFTFSVQTSRQKCNWITDIVFKSNSIK